LVASFLLFGPADQALAGLKEGQGTRLRRPPKKSLNERLALRPMADELGRFF
jgi:hypothetical protein